MIMTTDNCFANKFRLTNHNHLSVKVLSKQSLDIGSKP